MTRRGGVFTLQLLYLAGLGALAGLYFNDVLIHRQTLGTLPIAVPWWGAVGAVTLSLTGVFEHPSNTWKKDYAYWYWSRPFIGGTLASCPGFPDGCACSGKQHQHYRRHSDQPQVPLLLRGRVHCWLSRRDR